MRTMSVVCPIINRVLKTAHENPSLSFSFYNPIWADSKLIELSTEYLSKNYKFLVTDTARLYALTYTPDANKIKKALETYDDTIALVQDDWRLLLNVIKQAMTVDHKVMGVNPLITATQLKTYIQEHQKSTDDNKMFLIENTYFNAEYLYDLIRLFPHGTQSIVEMTNAKNTLHMRAFLCIDKNDGMGILCPCYKN